MKLILAVRHDEDASVAVAVGFDDWAASEPVRSYTSRVPAPPADAAAKAPKVDRTTRDIVAWSQLLREHALAPEALLIDGLVDLDASGDTPGPGRRLFDALAGRVPVIGVSKSAMPGATTQFEVHREEEAAPLIVTVAGIDLGAAKARVRAMHGRKRVPTLMKLAARLAKAG
jgi:deoxyribonuclease V